MSGQSPPSEHDQLGWLMGEVDRLRAELEQAKGWTKFWRDKVNNQGNVESDLRAELELEQEVSDLLRAERDALAESEKLFEELELARSTCPHSNCDAQRYKEALERIAWQSGYWQSNEFCKVARDALAGKGQT